VIDSQKQPISVVHVVAVPEHGVTVAAGMAVQTALVQVQLAPAKQVVLSVCMLAFMQVSAHFEQVLASEMAVPTAH